MKPVLFHPAAEVEIDEAAVYYHKQSPGLGETFLHEYGKAREWIEWNPLMFAKEEESEARLSQLNRFPFAIVYLNFDSYLWVIAVADLRRRPRYWASRLPN